MEEEAEEKACVGAYAPHARLFFVIFFHTPGEAAMKIAVIGGGSTYTPELVSGFLARTATFPVSELWLQDIDPHRLEIVGGFTQRMVAARDEPFGVRLTDDLREAIQGADYVITQFRVGMMPARRNDEYLGHRHGLVGQETTGVGGMAKALRTIPVMLEIAGAMREWAPEAMLVNFTNPSGLVTEALARYAPDVLAVGLCNSPTNARMMFLEIWQEQTGKRAQPSQAELLTLGLNHLTWHYGFKVDGQDVWPEVLRGVLAHLKREPEPMWDAGLIENLGMVPNYYLEYYYYTSRQLEKQAGWPPSRAEAVMEIEEDLLKQYARPDLREPPPGLMQRGGAYYSTAAAQLLNAHWNDLEEVHVVNTRQGAAVAGWPEDWVLELPCRVSRLGILPLPAEPLPPACFGLLAQVKAYELLAVEAAVHGDRKAAYQALLAHPLGPEAGQVQAVLDDMLETNREYLPRFWA